MRTIMRHNHLASVLTLLLIGAFLASSLVGAFAFFDDRPVRKDSQGAVAVTATYLASEGKEPRTGPIAFELVLDTHSVDLSQYRIEEISSIQFDDNEPLSGGTWDFTGSSHHYKGILSFTADVPAGTRIVRLIIRDIDGIEHRSFEWDVTGKN